MDPIPWSKVEGWACIACGDCCKDFRVPISAYEVARLAGSFGYWAIEAGLNSYYLKKRLDGRCAFQVRRSGRWICGVQPLKPMACKLWPFMVYEKPRYGCRDEAEYEFNGQRFYVYVNPYCRGLAYGKPSHTFESKVLPEFIEIKLGIRERQSLSTSSIVELEGGPPAGEAVGAQLLIVGTPRSPLNIVGALGDSARLYLRIPMP